MIYTIANDKLTVKLSDMGGEIVSVTSKDGCEYMWQGDKKYWSGRAPILFPICGRLSNDHYLYDGVRYDVPKHGFARKSLFSVESVTDNSVCFSLKENSDTLGMYPFKFTLKIEYVLSDNKITGNISIINTDDKMLPATVGLHPGFNVPLDGGDFEDWYLEYTEPCDPKHAIFTDECLFSGKTVPFALSDRKRLNLRHDLFDNDAIFLSDVSGEISLRSDKSAHSVTFLATGFPYMGFWHTMKSDAPFVCIEPWYGMASPDGSVDDISTKSDMFHIEVGDKKEVSYSLTFN